MLQKLQSYYKLWITIIFLMMAATNYAQCPSIEAILIDGCGIEQLNEFVVINSGTNGFNTNDITIDFPLGNNAMAIENNDINTDVDNFPPGTPCGLTFGNVNAYTGCSNLISIGPGFNVPPNSIVILQASNNSTNNLYDFSSLCGNGECVYVISNSCTRTIGAFTNGGGTGTRTTNFEFGGACTESVTYDRGPLANNDGAYYLPQSDTYGDDGCVVPPVSPAPDPQPTEFNITDEYCVGESPDVLPDSDNNGIAGSWNPASINTNTAGVNTYIFTPNPDQCGEPFELIVTVNPSVVPIFANINTQYCQNETPDILPAVSDNGIAGSWSPATINTSSTGTSNYTFTPDDPCAENFILSVTINPVVTPVFNNLQDEYCQSDTPGPLPAMSDNGLTGTWAPPSIDVSEEGTFDYVFTPTDACAETYTHTVDVYGTPRVSLNGGGLLCSGKCIEVGFMLLNGSGLYNVDMMISSPPFFNFGFPAAGIDANDVLTICYDGLVPLFDPNTNTVTIPTFLSGTGTVSVTNINDANTNCPGVIDPPSSVTITLAQTPNAIQPPPITACDDGTGVGIFDLSEVESIINGGTNNTVTFYSSPDLTGQVSNPYIGGSTTLYATVTASNGCESEPVEVELILITEGDVGDVSIDCGGGQTDCNICFDGTFQSITIFFNFPDAGSNYDVVMLYTINGVSDTYTNTFPGTGGTESFLITGPSFFQLIEVTRHGDCPAFSNLGDPVTVGFVIQPELDPIPNISECGSVILPPITGTNLSGNERYFTGPGGTGFTYFPGNVITENIVLYIFDGTSDCFDEQILFIDVVPETVYDEPDDVSGCNGYVLPPITGTDVGPNAGYYDGPMGFGTFFPVGSTITMPVTLYIFDITNECYENEPVFEVNVAIGPNIDPMDNVEECDEFVLPQIIGSNLTGNQAYFSGPNGTGTRFEEGDTIFSTMLIYIFDEIADCQEQEFFTININQLPHPGEDSSLSLCFGVENLDFFQAIGTGFTEGTWTDNDMTGLNLDNPANVSLASLQEGSYSFTYTVDGGICGEAAASLVLKLTPAPVAGLDSLTIWCDELPEQINLSDFLRNFSDGGYWELATGTNPDISNPDSVVIEGLNPGMYTIRYFTELIQGCAQDSAEITFEIRVPNQAGNNTSSTICIGSSIDLNDLLEGNNSTGFFEDPDSTGSLSGSVVDASSLMIGAFNFYHILAGDDLCISDTAVFTINVADEVFAGTDTSAFLCHQDDTVLLNPLLPGSTPGGVFAIIAGSGSVVNGIFNPDAEGEATVRYYVGDGIACPEDSADIIIGILPFPEAQIALEDNVFCENETIEFIINYNYPGSFNLRWIIRDEEEINQSGSGFRTIGTVDSLSDNGSISLNTEGINLQGGNRYYISVEGIESTICNFDLSDSAVQEFLILTAEVLRISENLCPGESVIIEGTEYNQTTTDTIILQNSIGCDSIIIIEVELLQVIENQVNLSLCTGQEILIGGITFNEFNQSGIVTIANAAANGCDSIIVVDLRFDDASYANINESICEGKEIEILGEIFDENRTFAEILLDETSQGGCDSIVIVNITVFNQPPPQLIDTTVCDENFELIFEGEIFNINRPVGMVSVENANPLFCDFLYEINIRFLEPGVEEISRNLCRGREIELNGTIYDENNTSGVEVLDIGALNGCDSIWNIQINLLENAMSNLNFNTCNENFEILLDGITFDRNNPSGIATLSQQASNGCDSMVNVNIVFSTPDLSTSIFDPDCPEDEGLFVINSFTGISPFSIQINGNSVGNFDVFPIETMLLPGNYQLTVSSADGCESNQLIEIFEREDIAAEISYNALGQNQFNISVTSSEAIYNLMWSPAQNLSCVDCLNPTASAPGVYTLNFQYGENCFGTAQILLESEPVTGIFIPNALRPLASGENAYFYLKKSPEDRSAGLSMAVYDRWGNQVFSKRDFEIGVREEGWNGRFNNTGDMVPGVYVYIIEVENAEGAIQVLKGSVTLFR
jgi:hypothetical protein